MSETEDVQERAEFMHGVAEIAKAYRAGVERRMGAFSTALNAAMREAAEKREREKLS